MLFTPTIRQFMEERQRRLRSGGVPPGLVGLTNQAGVLLTNAAGVVLTL